MNKTMKCAAAVIVMTLVSSAAMAETAFEQLGRLAGANVSPISKHIDEAKLAAQNENLTIPRFATDVLESCPAFEARPFVAWTLPQAVAQTQECLDNTFNQRPNARRMYTVTAHAGKFAVRLCPQTEGTFSCQAIAEVEGVILTISGKIMLGDGVLHNLNFSLDKRKGLLLGWHAMLDNKAEILH